MVVTLEWIPTTRNRRVVLPSRFLFKRWCRMTNDAGRAITAAMRTDNDSEPDSVHFDAILMPHRSLPRWGYALLIGGLAGALGLIGLAFWGLGAWPVSGFCGLEVVLVWGAFELNYRSGRVFETLCLDDRILHIARVQPSGRTATWTFEPGWVRVAVVPFGHDHNRLVVASHGKRVHIGAFLSDEERSDLADALNGALIRWRSAPDVI